MSRHVAVIGGSLTGNKGAASMVLAVVDQVRADDDSVEISVLSPLAGDDRPVARDLGVRLADYGAGAIIASVAAAVLCRLTGGRLQLTDAVRAMARADVVADVSGIAFVDGRGLPTLAYNVLLVLPALALGRPVVKVAQAMGPFRGRVNRVSARFVLSRMAGLLARGEATKEHLAELGVRFDGVAADVAFLMQVGDDDHAWAESVAPDEPFVCLAPSQVVVTQAQRAGVDYVEHVVAVADELADEAEVVLVAHSARPGHEASKLNDLPLCEQVLARVARPDKCRIAPSEANPRQLRALIGRSELLVTSRFHAMISGLAMGVPVLVIGWSHKYREVLSDFRIEDLCLDFRHVKAGDVPDVVRGVRARREAVGEQISEGLPAVHASAEQNGRLLHEAAVLHASVTLPPASERRAP